MDTGNGVVVVVVRPGRRTGTVMTWLRQLLPAAVLLVAPASPPPSAPGAPDEGDAIVLEADEIESPMALADALAKVHAGHLGD